MNGLVLEGGGARGSYHVGVIKALKKKHIKINCVVGTSIGAINGALVAQGEYKKLERLWRKATSKELFDIDNEVIELFKNKKLTKEMLKTGFMAFWKIIKNLGIDTSLLKKTLVCNIDEDKIRQSNIDFGLVTYNMSKGKSVRIFKEDIPQGKIIDYLLASSYLPIFKSQKIIDESYYIDGGLIDRCPIDMLGNKEFNNIYVVRTYMSRLPKVKTNAKIIEIKPSRKLGPLILFSKDTNNLNLSLGYFDALKIIDGLDGKKYYFGHKSIDYYRRLIKNKQTLKKYNKNKLLFNEKKIIINTLESICDYYNLKVFKIYNVPLLIIKLKILNSLKKNGIYSRFIKEMRVKLV